MAKLPPAMMVLPERPTRPFAAKTTRAPALEAATAAMVPAPPPPTASTSVTISRFPRVVSAMPSPPGPLLGAW